MNEPHSMVHLAEWDNFAATTDTRVSVVRESSVGPARIVRRFSNERRWCHSRMQVRSMHGLALRATSLEGAVLDIVHTPAKARCRECGAEEPTDSLSSSCSCGSFDRHLCAGDELRLKEVEVF